MTDSELQPLITQCPNCHTQFRVSEAQLQIAQGKVRCGACLTVFHGGDHLVWEQPGAATGADAEDALDDLLDELDAPQAGAVATGADAGETAIADGYFEPLTDARAEITRSQPVAAPDVTADSGQSARVPDDLAAAVAASFDEPQAAHPAGPTPRHAADSAPDPTLAEHISDELPDAPGTAATAAEPGAAEPGTAATLAAEARPAGAPRPGRPAPPGTSMPNVTTAAFGRDQQTTETEVDPFARLSAHKTEELPKPGGQRGWLLYVVTAVGLVLLAAQVLAFRFDTWTQNPAFRPIYAALCPLVGCELPLQKSLGQIESRNLTVRSHPSTAGALMVDAVIVNTAEFAQAFPIIELTFTDIDGKVIAGRRFTPEKYLAGELKGATSVEPKTPIRINLEIDDPGPAAVSYVMDFK